MQGMIFEDVLSGQSRINSACGNDGASIRQPPNLDFDEWRSLFIFMFGR
jgi:hypothetical protein